MHMVAEGVRATRMFLNRAERLDIEVPFLSALGNLLDGEEEVLNSGATNGRSLRSLA